MTYTYKPYKQNRDAFFPKQSKKTLGQQFGADLILLLISCSVFLLIQMILGFLFRPLMGEKDNFDEWIKEKRQKRYDRLRKFSEDPLDPMYQFHLRFIKDPDYYKNDPDNKVYQSWFDDWTKGHIKDSTLRWAPDVMLDYKINRTFLDYVRLQFNIHKKAGFLSRLIFITTISKYYPELSANLNELEQDLANYEAEFTKEDLTKELKEEIEKVGLPEGIAEYLATKNFNEKILIKKTEFLKSLINKGYSEETCIFVSENNIEKEYAETINLVIERTGLPARVGWAYAKGEITIEGLDEFAKNISSILEDYGIDAYKCPAGSNRTVYEDYIDIYLEQYRGKNVMECIRKKK